MKAQEPDSVQGRLCRKKRDKGWAPVRNASAKPRSLCSLDGRGGRPHVTIGLCGHPHVYLRFYLRPRKRMREVKARPWQAANVGVGWVESMMLLTTKGLQRPLMLSKPPRNAR